MLSPKHEEIQNPRRMLVDRDKEPATTSQTHQGKFPEFPQHGRVKMRSRNGIKIREDVAMFPNEFEIQSIKSSCLVGHIRTQFFQDQLFLVLGIERGCCKRSQQVELRIG